jgi:hypothetical protein
MPALFGLIIFHEKRAGLLCQHPAYKGATGKAFAAYMPTCSFNELHFSG